MPLLKRDQIHGTETVIEQDPAILTLPEVLYRPGAGPGNAAGIFDHGGRLVPPCSYFRGPDDGALGNPLISGHRYSAGPRAPDAAYVYCGHIHGHYGHFILSTLCRFWAFDKPELQGLKILYHSGEDISRWFETAYVADLFGAMGLGPANFVRFTEPTRITSLIVPCPSFEESGFIHRAFARLGQKLGDILIRGKTLPRCDTPVYFSKARLAGGVGHLVNEAELDDALAEHGIDIVYPEELSLAEQIALIRSRPTIMAMTGSSLHTTVFAPGRIIVSMGFHNSLPSSYTIMDRVNDARAYYFYPHNDIVQEEHSGRFSAAFRLTNVSETAEQFIRLTNMALSLSRDRTSFRLRGADDPEWPNIALGKPARQSSFGPWEDLHRPHGYASTATSGVLTGRYQFHTAQEHQPWWEVDLGATSRVRKIRLHNRSDNAQARAARFVIVGSVDGEVWEALHRQDDPLVFGNGLEGRAFTWVAGDDVRARFIRVKLLETTFLHLDQVEVLGEPPPAPAALAMAAGPG